MVRSEARWGHSECPRCVDSKSVHVCITIEMVAFFKKHPLSDEGGQRGGRLG